MGVAQSGAASNLPLTSRRRGQYRHLFQWCRVRRQRISRKIVLRPRGGMKMGETGQTRRSEEAGDDGDDGDEVVETERDGSERALNHRPPRALRRAPHRARKAVHRAPHRAAVLQRGPRVLVLNLLDHSHHGIRSQAVLNPLKR